MNWNILGDIHLLMVEDDMFNRLLLVSLLSKYSNVTVIEAKNGIEALDKLNEHKIDIILLDIHMPEMDGFETLHHIHNNKEIAHIPVMILSSDEVEEKKSLELGATAFIPKPFDLKALEQQIYEVLVS